MLCILWTSPPIVKLCIHNLASWSINSWTFCVRVLPKAISLILFLQFEAEARKSRNVGIIFLKKTLFSLACISFHLRIAFPHGAAS